MQVQASIFASSPPSLFLPQLKIDEFESNVNEVKDPYPSADFPGKAPEAALEHGAVEGSVCRCWILYVGLSCVSPTWTSPCEPGP